MNYEDEFMITKTRPGTLSGCPALPKQDSTKVMRRALASLFTEMGVRNTISSLHFDSILSENDIKSTIYQIKRCVDKLCI